MREGGCERRHARWQRAVVAEEEEEEWHHHLPKPRRKPDSLAELVAFSQNDGSLMTTPVDSVSIGTPGCAHAGRARCA